MVLLEARKLEAEARLWNEKQKFSNLQFPDFKNVDRPSFEALQLITRNHVQSFDYSIDHQLKNGIKYLRGLEWTFNNDTKLAVKVISARLLKPQVHPDCSARTRELYPSECRMGERSYKGALVLSIQIEMDGKVIDSFEEKVGEIPIMVRSKYCNLHNKSPKELVQHMEDSEEAGGYFIINGREKVVRLLIAQVRNYPIVMTRKSWRKAALLFSDLGVMIRCVRPDGLSNDMVLHYMTNGQVKVRVYIDKGLVFIPLVLLLKGMVKRSFKQIASDLLAGSEHDTYFHDCIINMCEMLSDENLESDKQMLSYIGEQVRPRLSYLGSWHTNEYVGNHFISHFVAAHLDKFVDKYNYLIFCTQKLFAARRGDCAFENLDSPQLQEIYTSGQIYTNYLLERLNMMMNSVRLQLSRQIERTKSGFELTPTAVRKALTQSYNEVCNSMTRLLSVGSIGGIGTVGLRQTTSFSVMAEKINYCRFLSHFRAVHRGSFFTTMRTTEGRKLYPESWGFLCPVHTPDGEPCGLLNHLAIDCSVLAEQPPIDDLANILEKLGMHSIYSKTASSTPIRDCTVVVLNGCVLGHVPDEQIDDFVHQLRVLKSRQSSKEFKRLGGRVTPMLEIGHVSKTTAATQYPGVFLFASPHRMMRPVTNLSTNRCELIGIFEQVYLEIAVCEEEQQPTTTHVEIRQTAMLSLLAGMIPYPDFNQSPRNMYCCQMTKQTMGTATQSLRYKSETKMYSITTPQTPFCRTRFYDAYNMDQYPIGTNAVVAVISYTGYDMEDALILNKAAVERGFKNGVITKSQTFDLNEMCKENKSVRFGRLESDTSLAGMIDMDGLPLLGRALHYDDPICSYIDPNTGKTKVERYRSTEVAYVTDVKVVGHANGRDPMTKIIVTLHIPRRPAIGDKFANRHGQKGVVSYLYPNENMPFSNQGIIPDVIFNPHGFPSRMTIGQMLESMAGKVACVDGKVKDATPFEFSESNVASDHYGEELKKAGFNYYGTETMYSGIDGRPLNADIFMGVIYYIRLRHMVGDKYQVRSTGPIDPLTHQPVKGRKRCGGIRFGEMERDSLLAHGASFLLHDRLYNQSDRNMVCRVFF